MFRFALFIVWATVPASVFAQFDIEREPINYLKAPLTDPISRLQKRLDADEVQLTFDDKNGYLASVLKTLDVSETSQMLVFSKTSFQRNRINPRTPRAIYFNDDVYVGWCVICVP